MQLRNLKLKLFLDFMELYLYIPTAIKVTRIILSLRIETYLLNLFYIYIDIYRRICVLQHTFTNVHEKWK